MKKDTLPGSKQKTKSRFSKLIASKIPEPTIAMTI